MSTYKTKSSIIKEILEYLRKDNLKLSKKHKDGRLNASINEDEVLNSLHKKFELNIPKSRAWFDFSFEESGIFYPVNIKVTDTTHADNLNCKLGIYYSLTGILPDFSNEINWMRYFEKLKTNLSRHKNKDYHFLVINKNNTEDVFHNTLRGLKKIQPNGNNLPFQCKWNENRIYEKRSFQNSVNFILTNFGKSIKLRSEIYFNFKKYFNEFL
ncbi:MAG TPA: restriction endonuclease [Bacteroidetes bacterium]|nr:restriction endonuclease [Bacteroidota bacterium]